MSRAAMLVILGSATVLGGAWLAARALTSDVSLPPPRETAVREVPAPPPAPSPHDERPAPAQPAPVATPAPVAPRGPEATVAPAADPPSEYASEHSPEIERAWELAFGRKNNPLRWRQAARVFSECISEVPTNQRCQEGFAATRALIQSTKRLPGASQPPEPSERPARRSGMSRGSSADE